MCLYESDTRWIWLGQLFFHRATKRCLKDFLCVLKIDKILILIDTRVKSQMLYLHNNKRRDLSFTVEWRRKNIYKHREHPSLLTLDPFSANSSQKNKIIIWAEESHPFFFENPFIIIIILYNKSIMFRQEHPKWFSRNLSEWKINKHKREEEEGERKEKKENRVRESCLCVVVGGEWEARATTTRRRKVEEIRE